MASDEKTTGPSALFALPDTQDVMSKVQKKIEREYIDKPASDRSVADFMRRFIFMALKDFQIRAAEYDAACVFNRQLFRERFGHALLQYDGAEAGLSTLFSMCYRFVVEFDFVTPEGASNALSAARNEFFALDLEQYPEAQAQFQWANTHMPMSILKASFNQEDLKGVKSFGSFLKNATSEFSRFEEEFERKLIRVGELEARLRSGEQDLNFANINKGFANLKKAKKREKFRSLLGMWVFGLALVAAPLMKLFSVFSEPVDEHDLIIKAVALLGLELLLIYFFRIFLNNFRSLNQQILQIDLRMTLCSFIESYSEFAVKIREADKEALSKFEHIIFSEVSFGDSSLPSAFEGVEHVSSVFGKIRNK